MWHSSAIQATHSHAKAYAQEYPNNDSGWNQWATDLTAIKEHPLILAQRQKMKLIIFSDEPKPVDPLLT
jgi:hypothetical protein